MLQTYKKIRFCWIKLSIREHYKTYDSSISMKMALILCLTDDWKPINVIMQTV